MRKTLTQSSFLFTAILVVALFLTARTYTQLTLASLLYVPVAYIAYKLFAHRSHHEHDSSLHIPSHTASAAPPLHAKPLEDDTEDIEDRDKRAFLGMIGAAGLSFFLYSLFSRNGSNLLLGRNTTPGNTTLTDLEGRPINPAERQAFEGYRISEIDDSNSLTFYGFTNTQGAWLIMKEDASTSSFRYVKGDSAFPSSWDSREDLTYDYYYNVF